MPGASWIGLNCRGGGLEEYYMLFCRLFLVSVGLGLQVLGDEFLPRREKSVSIENGLIGYGWE
jgi:hypothetical protein